MDALVETLRATLDEYDDLQLSSVFVCPSGHNRIIRGIHCRVALGLHGIDAILKKIARNDVNRTVADIIQSTLARNEPFCVGNIHLDSKINKTKPGTRDRFIYEYIENTR